MRATGKKIALTGSIFHFWALTGQAWAEHAMRSNPLTTLSKTFLFNPEMYRGARSGLWEMAGKDSGDAPPALRMQNRPVAQDAAQHGLDMRSEETEHWVYSKLQELTMSQNKIAKSLGLAVKPVAGVLKAFDRALWDFYHPGLMLSAYETILSDEIPRLGPNPDPAALKELKIAAAQHINNAYGAVDYKRMLLSPKVRQSLNWLFLAPAWSISNIRSLTAGYETEAGVRLTNRYVLGAAVSSFLSTQMMNYALSGWYTRNDPDGPKPRLTWDNPGLPVMLYGKRMEGLTENSFNVYAGRNKDGPNGDYGSERYFVPNKMFREPFGWLLAPMETFWGKTSMPARGAMTLATGHAPGSGFEEVDPRESDSVQHEQELGVVLESAGLPFTARDTVKKGLHAVFPEAIPKPTVSSQFMSLPTRKGASFMRVESQYRDARDADDDDTANDILDVAVANGINPAKIKQTYRTDLAKRRKRAAQ